MFGAVHGPTVGIRPDILDLAVSFREENPNSWGGMRLLDRWFERQPWRKALPKSFASPCCTYRSEVQHLHAYHPTSVRYTHQ